ncbi:MAG: hypothetical protein A2161_14525 [Candidatus Schekmanbacteria bacterium RBG_13_48_7]|uniref:DNA polymerase n=1 Tax=Candidatus Schekmanbacteria bacterium RBG_13_48_7 TaxID=1817878 RepID=A0A1F7RRA2_9BACT|nr:MAG: hypothetical protein A2161_14525 [Candidatus Schekmanbacteria bacterium RBG_13_48_7]
MLFKNRYTRYLIDHQLRGTLLISGDYQKGETVDRIYLNPKLEPSDFMGLKYNLRILSLDIETDFQGSRLYSIATYNGKTGKVYMIGSTGNDIPENTEFFESEILLLKNFMQDLMEYDPDIITGWNVINFDFAFLDRRCQQFKIPLKLGRTKGTSKFISDETYTMTPRMVVPGRQVLDGIQLVRGSYHRLEDYTLDTAAHEILGERKKISGDNRSKQIDDMFRYDKRALSDYNLHDAKLVYDILLKTKSIDLVITRSCLTGMPFDRVSASIASFDFLYLMKLRKRGYVAPCVAGPRGEHDVMGGYVLDSEPGFHDNVIVFDFKSLYPTIIMTFNIDPLTLIHSESESSDSIKAPNGASFKRNRGILPEILMELLLQREMAVQKGDYAMSNAVKLLMNSFYGVLATPSCRFYSVKIANAITYFGQYLLKKTAELITRMNYSVIYGDTDSIFIKSDTDNFLEAKNRAEKICEVINSQIQDIVQNEFNCKSYLKIEFEKLYWRFFMPRIRHGSEGSKKRYAGLIDPDNPDLIEFVGLETVRRDWTDLAKLVQRELLIRVFSGNDYTDFLKNLVRNLKEGNYDNLLIYKKALRKNLEEYTKTTPPHVKAARKQSKISSRLIFYVITTGGPEPVNQLQHKPDYQHYIDKQIEPVADSILDFFGKKFKEIIQPAQQLDLF